MNRLSEAFAGFQHAARPAVIPYITAGDPDAAATAELVVALGKAGAAVIEIGVPFSDPIADGPVIQRACQRALRRGMGVGDVLAVVREARKGTQVPIILFSYYNPLLRFGLERLPQEARSAGVDGVLVTDLPVEEAEPLGTALSREELDCIFLVAPTSTEARLLKIASLAGGFIYVVSRTGITGTREQVSAEAERLVARVRTVSELPVAVGFGISTAAQVNEVCRYADAAVVGSALVSEIEAAQCDPHLVGRVTNRFRGLLAAAEPAAR